MIALILACAILLSFVIDLSLWQGIVVVLFIGSVYITGRRLEIEQAKYY